MINPEGLQPNSYNNISDLLLSADEIMSSLHQAAGERLANGDDSGHDDMVFEQTRLVLGLADAIAEFKDNGFQVPKEVEEITADHSEAARFALQEGKDYPRYAIVTRPRTDNMTILKVLSEKYQQNS